MELSPRAETSIRIGCAAGLLVALFLARWDFSLEHFDFRVWRAADLLLHEGANPYDGDVLNETLNTRFPLTIDQDVGQLFLFNPPTWITQVRAMGTSALVMSFAGAVALFASILILSNDAALERTLGYLFGASYFLYLTPSVTTFRFGQTGLLLGGLVGLRLVLLGTRAGGLPAALLSFKPHLAVASILGELQTSRRWKVIVSAGGGFVALVAVQLIQDGPSPWLWWLDSLSISRPFGTLTDMSFRTLSPHLDFDAVVGIPSLCVALIAATALSMRWKTADPRLLTLMNLGLLAYLSGHAFEHDWLWLVYVPVICCWSVQRTLIVALVFSSIHTLVNSMRVDDAVIGPKSLLALAACIYVVRAVQRSSALTNSPESNALLQQSHV